MTTNAAAPPTTGDLTPAEDEEDDGILSVQRRASCDNVDYY